VGNRGFSGARFAMSSRGTAEVPTRADSLLRSMQERHRISSWRIARRLQSLASSPLLHRLAAVAAFAAVVLLVVWVWPPRLNRRPAGSTITQAEWLTAVNATRASLVLLLAGSAALVTVLYTVKTYALTRAGQVTDRYTKAVDQLASEKVAVRIGGLNALERISRDSPADQHAVTDVLIAFVRERLDGAEALTAQTAGLPADVQAALGVVARRTGGSGVSTINLSGMNLRGADLSGMDLSHARLDGACLDDADLHDSVLDGANAAGAQLRKAKLGGASLLRCNLEGADLTGADLYRARVLPSDLSAEQISTVTSWDAIIPYTEAGQFLRPVRDDSEPRSQLEVLTARVREGIRRLR
jgi:hypothetical protein